MERASRWWRTGSPEPPCHLCIQKAPTGHSFLVRVPLPRKRLHVASARWTEGGRESLELGLACRNRNCRSGAVGAIVRRHADIKGDECRRDRVTSKLCDGSHYRR